MKPLTIIHTTAGDKIKTAEPFVALRKQTYEAQSGQFIIFNRLTDHGSQRECWLAMESVSRIESVV